MSGCEQRQSVLDDCPWTVGFPGAPSVELLLDGRVVRKQRASLSSDNRIFRASCTLWKKGGHKETDERWMQRVRRALHITLLDIEKSQVKGYSVVRLTASHRCPGVECSHYWLHSYFDGRSRLMLLYRVRSSTLDRQGKAFLGSVRDRPESPINNDSRGGDSGLH